MKGFEYRVDHLPIFGSGKKFTEIILRFYKNLVLSKFTNAELGTSEVIHCSILLYNCYIL